VILKFASVRSEMFASDILTFFFNGLNSSSACKHLHVVCHTSLCMVFHTNSSSEVEDRVGSISDNGLGL